MFQILSLFQKIVAFTLLKCLVALEGHRVPVRMLTNLKIAASLASEGLLVQKLAARMSTLHKIAA